MTDAKRTPSGDKRANRLQKIEKWKTSFHLTFIANKQRREQNNIYHSFFLLSSAARFGNLAISNSLFPTNTIQILPPKSNSKSRIQLFTHAIRGNVKWFAIQPNRIQIKTNRFTHDSHLWHWYSNFHLVPNFEHNLSINQICHRTNNVLSRRITKKNEHFPLWEQEISVVTLIRVDFSSDLLLWNWTWSKNRVCTRKIGQFLVRYHQHRCT